MNIVYNNELEIQYLVEKFISRTLEKKDWTHYAHLTVGLWHLKNFELDESVCRMKSSIICYNVSTNTLNTGSTGYHETLTIFWLEILRFFISMHPYDSLLDTCNLFLNSPLSDRKLAAQFYDEKELMSTLHRSRYMLPTKKGLDRETLREYLQIA